MHVVAIQLEIAWEDRAANHMRVHRLLDADPPPPGALLVLPEMFASGFSMNVDRITQDERHTDEIFIAGICRKYGVSCIAGVVNRGANGRGRNEAVVIDREGSVIGRYRKLYLFSPGNEDQHYEPGTEIVTVDVSGFRVAPMVCYDLRFPEIFRIAAQRGANLFVVIANWPDARAEQRLILLRARAMENQAYVIGVNRSGDDPDNHYAGGSVIINPRGEIVAEADERQRLLSADLDLASLMAFRSSTPWLRDMRSEFLIDASG